MAKPLTERVTVNGNIITVEDCDGTKKVYELDCSCSDGGGETVPDPPSETDDACDKYNTYASAIVDIISELQNQFALQPHNNFGHDIAIGAAAYNKGLPLSPWVFDTRWFFRTEAGSDNYDDFNATQFMQSTVYEDLVCVVKETFTAGNGIFTYENFVVRMQSAGFHTHGVVIAFIPIARFKELIYLLGVAQPPLSSPGFTASDCECGGDVPEPVDCDSPCEVTACHKLIPLPSTGNEFVVTGFDEVIDFDDPKDGCWFGSNFNPLRIDMLANRCVKRIVMHAYTACGQNGSNGGRSAYYRVEVDDVAVTDFKCQAIGSVNYYECGSLGGFDGAGAIEFIFPTPLLGRHIKIVPQRAILTIVQVDIITCVD